MNFKGYFFPKVSTEACKYKLSHGKSVSSQQQREKQSQAGKQPVNSLRAGLQSPNIERLFLAIIFTSGANRHYVLVNVRVPSGITGAQMPALSAASAFLM